MVVNNQSILRKQELEARPDWYYSEMFVFLDGIFRGMLDNERIQKVYRFFDSNDTEFIIKEVSDTKLAVALSDKKLRNCPHFVFPSRKEKRRVLKLTKKVVTVVGSNLGFAQRHYDKNFSLIAVYGVDSESNLIGWKRENQNSMST